MPRQQMEMKIVYSVYKEVQVRGFLFEIEVFLEQTSGGSNSYGSDEPYWVDVEILDIYNCRRGKAVSAKLHDEIIRLYEDTLTSG